MISTAPRSVLVLALAAVLLGGCATPSSRRDPFLATPSDSLWVRDELYFGASIPTGGEVTDAMWERFLDAEVTPRYPDGLTTIDATGRYRYATGEIARERSWILLLLHRGGPENEGKIVAILEAYKKAFAQESVLRVTSRAAVRFFE